MAESYLSDVFICLSTDFKEESSHTGSKLLSPLLQNLSWVFMEHMARQDKWCARPNMLRIIATNMHDMHTCI